MVTTVSGTDNILRKVLKYKNRQATQGVQTWHDYP